MTAAVQCAQRDTLVLNQTCYCFPVHRKPIDDHIIGSSHHDGMAGLLADRKNYFASTGVFLSKSDLASMQAQITAIENAVRLPAFKSAIFSRGYKAAYDVQPETQGVFMGYDFHMTEDAPRLIEINSNAGGAFMVDAIEQSIGKTQTQTEDKIGRMFLQEWRYAGRKGRPATIAIIDENPEAQFHYPDMCLAAATLTRQGFEVFIVDPKQLSYQNKTLAFGDITIDFVYNRLTDFSLTGPYTASLAQALAEDAVVISPNPRHHAFHADKRNLVMLSNLQSDLSIALTDTDRAALSLIPETVLVTSENAEALWSQRRQYFFKPYGGFGSRGVYRGAKLTTRVWAEIIQGGYIAQKFIPPSLRAVGDALGKAELKFDLRAYTYDGEILLLAARVYQGQTTNMRTEGGGLAPVLIIEP